MKVNLDAFGNLGQSGKLQFLIIETWQGMEPSATYEEQARAVRRALDAVDYVEQAFQNGTVVMMHKAADSPTTFTLVAVDSHEALNDFIKGNAAHVRVRPELRKVVPLADWDSGRGTFERLISELETKSREENEAIEKNEFVPFPGPTPEGEGE